MSSSRLQIVPILSRIHLEIERALVFQDEHRLRDRAGRCLQDDRIGAERNGVRPHSLRDRIEISANFERTPLDWPSSLIEENEAIRAALFGREGCEGRNVRPK